MISLTQAALRQMSASSDFPEIVLFSVIGIAISLALIHFGVNPDVGY
jgi:hypothetical protein